ncbi:MAG: hypothetical protein ACTHOU_06520 [Aureliella sp.]
MMMLPAALRGRSGAGPGHGLPRIALLMCTWLAVVGAGRLPVRQATAAQPTRCVMIEVYFRQSDPQRAEVLAAAESLKASRKGLTVTLRPIDEQASHRERWNAVLKHFKLPSETSPVIYGCNRVIASATASNSWTVQLEQLLQLELFARAGCPHCAAAKAWLPSLLAEYPALQLVTHDIVAQPASRTRLATLVQQHRTTAASVPVFYVCDSLVVGFDSAESAGERLRKLLKPWTYECSLGAGNLRPLSNLVRPASFQSSGAESAEAASSPPELELPLSEEELSSEGDTSTGDDVRVPIFGRLSASKLGMPLFTVAIGLIDGFNPCAMWVLIFLLSILVNLGDRRKMLAIAGVFVVVSGLAYFAFMAAWLNVFVLIGYLRPIEVTLALLAITVGAVHIKDFFAFKKGISLSIPESAKPGIYARVRQIVTAEHLTGAIIGAITLAVLVNTIELLCTAGLPALYTNILTQQSYSPLVRYGYLSLYILAYMFDDILMLGAVVITLSKRRLQESEGRWLKLISGSAIVLLGIVMLLRPDWLH